MWRWASITGGFAGLCGTLRAGGVVPPAGRHHDAAIAAAIAGGGRWMFGTGVQWRNIGEVSFETRLGPRPVPPPPPGWIPPPPIDIDTLRDRTYQNGFVFLDASGGYTTANFGYVSDSQMVGETLRYTAAVYQVPFVETLVAESFPMVAQTAEPDNPIAPYLAISYDVPVGDRLRAGVALNVSMLGLDTAQRGVQSFYTSQRLGWNQVTVTDIYQIGATELPAAPYQGSFGATRPTIPSLPASQTSSGIRIPGSLTTHTDRIDQELELDLYSLALGGHLSVELAERWTARVEAGGVLNFADWKGRQQEWLLEASDGGPASSSGVADFRSSDTRVLVGAYVQAALLWQLTAAWELECMARYDVNEALGGRIGPSGFEVDLDGWSIGVGVNFRY